MRRLHQNGWNDADGIIVGLAKLGYALTPQSRILDFGCGAGRVVYQFRDLGLEAFGFDIHNYVEPRGHGDEEWFRVGGAARADNSDMTLGDALRIPFEDGSFDFVFSTSTLEHVLDLAGAAKELARVTKPDGVNLHLYPRHRVLFEPHTLVPLGGMIDRWWWFYLWANIGWRLEWQKAVPANQIADANFRYSQSGVAYRSVRQMREACGSAFRAAYLVDDIYHSNRSMRDKAASVRRSLRAENPVSALAARPLPHAMLMTHPIKPRGVCGINVAAPRDADETTTS